jgi:chromatin modification-related protein EAF6
MTSMPGASTGATNGVSLPPPQSLEEANQRYAAVKSTLRSGLERKRLIDKALIDLESQIYLFEGSYLSSTASSGGNIVKGFDAYLKTTNPNAASLAAISGRGGADAVQPEDRIFSASSATFERSIELKRIEQETGGGSSALDTTANGHKATPPPQSAVEGKSGSANSHAEKSGKHSHSHSSSGLKRKHDESLGSGKNTKKKKHD